MPRYQYRATNMAGKIQEGVVEATGKKAVFEMIRSRDFYPLEIRRINEPEETRDIQLFKRVTLKDMAVFCKQFSSVLNAGIPLVQALELIINQIENTLFRKILSQLLVQLKKGKTISEAIGKYERYFPAILIHVVEASEVSGTLPQSLQRMALHFETQYRFRHKIQRALTYPCFIMVAAIIVLYFMLTQVVPQFFIILGKDTSPLPYPTRMLLNISSAAEKNGLLTIIIMTAICLAFMILHANPKFRYAFHRLLLKWPLIGKIYVKIVSARFSRTLSIMLSTGVPLTHAVTAAAKVAGNSAVAQEMEKAVIWVQQGETLSGSISQLELFPPMLTNMIAIGEESGSLDVMMEKVSEFYELEVETAMEKMITLLEPVAIIILGGIVGFIILAVALPMFDMLHFMG